MFPFFVAVLAFVGAAGYFAHRVRRDKEMKKPVALLQLCWPGDVPDETAQRLLVAAAKLDHGREYEIALAPRELSGHAGATAKERHEFFVVTAKVKHISTDEILHSMERHFEEPPIGPSSYFLVPAGVEEERAAARQVTLAGGAAVHH